MVNGFVSGIAGGATVAITIKAIDEFSATMKSAVTSTNKMQAALKIAAVSVTAFAGSMAALGVSSIKVAGDFEQTQIAFETMLGSAEEADLFLKQLADFAKKTPFTLKGVERSARQLLAVGFEANQVLPTLKNVGDVAAGLGLGEEGLQRLILNLGQVQTQGKLTGRELRDFAVAGVPLLDVLSQQLGVTTTEIQEMISAGEISSTVVMQAFRSMASEGGRFANLMSKQAETVNGKFSNLQDTFELMKRELGEALLPVVGELADTFLNDVLPAIKPLIPVIADSLKNALQSIIPLLPEIIESFKGMVLFGTQVLNVLIPLFTAAMRLGLALGSILMPILQAIMPVLAEIIEVTTDWWRILSKVARAIGKIIRLIPGMGGGGDFEGRVPEGAIDLTGGNTINLNVDRMMGVDADDIMEAAAIHLNSMIRL